MTKTERSDLVYQLLQLLKRSDAGYKLLQLLKRSDPGYKLLQLFKSSGYKLLQLLRYFDQARLQRQQQQQQQQPQPVLENRTNDLSGVGNSSSTERETEDQNSQQPFSYFVYEVLDLKSRPPPKAQSNM